MNFYISIIAELKIKKPWFSFKVPIEVLEIHVVNILCENGFNITLINNSANITQKGIRHSPFNNYLEGISGHVNNIHQISQIIRSFIAFHSEGKNHTVWIKETGYQAASIERLSIECPLFDLTQYESFKVQELGAEHFLKSLEYNLSLPATFQDELSDMIDVFRSHPEYPDWNNKKYDLYSRNVWLSKLNLFFKKYNKKNSIENESW